MIPQGWRQYRLGSVARTIVPQRDKPTDLTGSIPWLRIEDFEGKYLTSSKSGQGVTQDQVDSMPLRVFPPRTVVTSCSCIMGATAIATRPIITNQTFIGLSPDENAVTSDFLYYLMQHKQEELQAQATGAVQQYLSQQDFRAVRFAAPSVEEQKEVSDYLDRETAQIDALIEEQQRLVGLLRERRFALVAHAALSGSDHSVARLGWFVRVSSGDGLAVEDIAKHPADKAVPVVGGNGVMGYTDRSNVTDSTLAIGRVGALCGNAHRVDPPAWITDNALRLDDVRDFDLDYLRWHLEGLNLNRQSRSTAQPLITGSQVASLIVPLIPVADQRQIAATLDEQTEKIAALILEVERFIALSRERRVALITAVVTGQIDVRDEVAV